MTYTASKLARTGWLILAMTANALGAQAPDPPLWVRSLAELSSHHSPVGSPVQMVVTRDYATSAGILIPMGSHVTGTVVQATRKKHSALRLAFHQVTIGGQTFPLAAHVQSVDNARERVEPDGTILGLDELRKRPGKVEMILLAAAYVHPALLVSFETTKYIVREVKRPEVHYAAGTDLALQVDRLPARPLSPLAPESSTSEPLRQVLDGLPWRTETKHGKPSDWVNLALVGSNDELLRAFEAAGWTSSARLSLRSDAKTFLAVATHHAYQAGPMSLLLLAGRQPDLVFQKQTNTFAKRHHIRCWQTERTWQGKPVWVASATHDIGIEFSHSAKTFTHRIDEDIDAERAKVISDLRFADRVDAMSSFTRPAIPEISINGTGDPIRTDGRLAVVELR